jgi:hypothetical protein
MSVYAIGGLVLIMVGIVIYRFYERIKKSCAPLELETSVNSQGFSASSPFIGKGDVDSNSPQPGDMGTPARGVGSVHTTRGKGDANRTEMRRRSLGEVRRLGVV